MSVVRSLTLVRRLFTLTRSGPEIRDIASKVAQSLEASWTTASEFTYSYTTRRKTMIATVPISASGEARMTLGLNSIPTETKNSTACRDSSAWDAPRM